MPRSCHGLYVYRRLVLIAQAIFFLDRTQADRQTQLNALPHAGGYTSDVRNKWCIHRLVRSAQAL